MMNEKEIRIRLDLNESPYNIMELLKNEIYEELEKNPFNRYPDKNCLELKKCISQYTDAKLEEIAVGNGSDELIMLLAQSFLGKGDKLQIQRPTFSMYKHYAALMGAEVLAYKLDNSFQMDIEAFKATIEREQPKLVIICNPNNPTGRFLEISEIDTIAQGTNGIIVVDEAYYEFCGKSAIELLKKYDNMVILRTLSKAFGLAGLRVGYMLGSKGIIDKIDKIRSPFNVNVYSQAIASAVIKNWSKVKNTVDMITSERSKLYEGLFSLGKFEVFRSEANFILISSPKKTTIYEGLLAAGIKLRSFEDDMLKDCLRITVGTAYENNELLKVLEVICSG